MRLVRVGELVRLLLELLISIRCLKLIRGLLVSSARLLLLLLVELLLLWLLLLLLLLLLETELRQLLRLLWLKILSLHIGLLLLLLERLTKIRGGGCLRIKRITGGENLGARGL